MSEHRIGVKMPEKSDKISDDEQPRVGVDLSGIEIR
jgi:hypothetical protein